MDVSSKTLGPVEAINAEAKISCYRQVSTWFFPHPAIWVLGLFFAIVEIVWIYYSGFTFEFGNTSNSFILAGIGVIIAAGFSRQKMELLAITVFTFAFFVFFGKIANVLNYLFHSLGMPWTDANLASIEKAMGFDWLAVLEFFNTHDRFSKITFAAYDLLTLWCFITVVYLLLMRRFERLREFMLLFAAGAIITIIIGAFFPAGGAYHYYKPDTVLLDNLNPLAGRFFLPHLISIHDGTMTHIDLDKVTGLVTFPSFHTTMALFMIWATRRTMLFVAITIINSTLIVATPVYGGHYIPDLMGGAIVAVVCVFGYNVWSGRQRGMVHPVAPFRLFRESKSIEPM